MKRIRKRQIMQVLAESIVQMNYRAGKNGYCSEHIQEITFED
ncbi:MAG: hypothetical protein ACLTKE_05420 [Coprococcus sp.]